MKSFSIKNGLFVLLAYTIILSLLAVARGTASSPDFLQRVILVALSGFLVGYFLSPLVYTIQGSFLRRFGILSLLIFSLATISNVLETILYLPAVAIVGTVSGGILQTIILATTLVLSTRSISKNENSKKIKLQINQCLLFIVILAVLWIPIYFLFETLDTPVVRWLEHSSGDVFSHPSTFVIICLEFLRGFIHAGVLLWIVHHAGGNQRRLWIWGSLTLAILNGWLPILPVSTLPISIRVANGIEISLSSIAFAGISFYVFTWIKTILITKSSDTQ